MPTMSPPSVCDQAGGRLGGAAGGEHVVDDEHPLGGVDGVAVDLELVGAVLELVLLAGHGPRELAGLAHRDEGGADAIGDRRAGDEAAGLDADDAVDADSVEAATELVDGPAEPFAVAEQRA